MNKLILIGNGGHSKVIQDIVQSAGNLELYAILDDNLVETSKKNGILYSNIDYMNMINIQDFYFLIAIGDNLVRRNIYEKLSIPVNQYAVLIHPSAVISKSAKLGNGTVIMPNAVVNAASVVGNHTIINTGAIVEHDNSLGDYVHISPNATLSGTVTVKEGAHIGSAATVIPSKTIGSWSKIGAGAVVVDDITDGVTVVGVPARHSK